MAFINGNQFDQESAWCFQFSQLRKRLKVCIVPCSSFICLSDWCVIYKLSGTYHFQSATSCAVANSAVERSNLEENGLAFIENVQLQFYIQGSLSGGGRGTPQSLGEGEVKVIPVVCPHQALKKTPVGKMLALLQQQNKRRCSQLVGRCARGYMV